MANIKSAEKRIHINERNRLRNRFYKSSVRTLMKTFFKQLEVYKLSQSREDQEKVQIRLNLVYSFLDKGTKKKIFHKNAAARKKANLAAYFKATSV